MLWAASQKLMRGGACEPCVLEGPASRPFLPCGQRRRFAGNVMLATRDRDYDAALPRTRARRSRSGVVKRLFQLREEPQRAGRVGRSRRMSADRLVNHFLDLDDDGSAASTPTSSKYAKGPSPLLRVPTRTARGSCDAAAAGGPVSISTADAATAAAEEISKPASQATLASPGGPTSEEEIVPVRRRRKSPLEVRVPQASRAEETGATPAWTQPSAEVFSFGGPLQYDSDSGSASTRGPIAKAYMMSHSDTSCDEEASGSACNINGHLEAMNGAMPSVRDVPAFVDCLPGPLGLGPELYMSLRRMRVHKPC